jgi:hypothetical protein
MHGDNIGQDVVDAWKSTSGKTMRRLIIRTQNAMSAGTYMEPNEEGSTPKSLICLVTPKGFEPVTARLGSGARLANSSDTDVRYRWLRAHDLNLRSLGRAGDLRGCVRLCGAWLSRGCNGRRPNLFNFHDFYFCRRILIPPFPGSNPGAPAT